VVARSFRELEESLDNAPGRYWSSQQFPAFWTIINSRPKFESEDAFNDHLLKYLNSTIGVLMEWRRPITMVQRMNTLLYRGKHFMSQDYYSNMSSRRASSRRFSQRAKIVLNYLGQAADFYVAEMSAFEPNLTVRPKNDEESDRVAARMNKLAIDHYFYTLDLKTRLNPLHARTKIHGEAFGFVRWDVDAGDVHPAMRQIRETRARMGMDPNEPLPLVDPTTGEPITDDDGKEMFISRTVKTGDVVFDVEYSERVLYPCPPSCLWEDVPYVHRLMLMDIDEVKARWPASAAFIKTDGMYNDYFVQPGRTLTQQVVVRYTYHKPTSFLEQGYTCYSTEHCILQKGPKEFNHDYLPCVRMTDIDVPHEVTGMSSFQNLAAMNQAMNLSTSAIMQNQQDFAHPKYVVPRGAKVKYVQLENESGMYEFSGPIKPEILAQNSTAQDTWQWREAMRSEFRTLAMLDNPSSGEAPKGITANVALRMLEEQYRKLKKPSIDKWGKVVERIGELILATLGTYRDPTDGSLIQVLGKNNERYLKYFDVENLSRQYSVELIKSSGLPESPAAKTQTVLDLAAQFPDMWKNDEVLEYLDIARPEKLIESATISRQAAESEVEDIMSGIVIAPPQEYQDILPRYRVYEKAVQSRTFDEADPVIKQRMILHIMGAEYIIMKKMRNPAFAQKVLLELPNFPMYLPDPQPPVSPPLLLNTGQPQMGAGGAPPLGGLPPGAAGAAMPMPPEAGVTPPSQTPMPGNQPEQPVLP
jgi:hypothetical protein